MKTIILGDLHGKSFWKLILNTQKWDRVIFLGDYFDSFNIPGIEQLHNLKEIIEFKKNSEKEVILLLGNHDGYISPQIRQRSISGYQPKLAPEIHRILYENKDLFQMAYSFDNYLCTHAGVSEEWLKNNGWKKKKYTTKTLVKFINELWEYKPKSFDFTGVYDSYGDECIQTPIWIRPPSLIKSSKNIKAQGIIQIIGHTKAYTLVLNEPRLSGYILTDTFDTSQEYLIIDGDKLIIIKF